MKIALLGYGKMGQMVDRAAQKRGHTIVARLTSSKKNKTALVNADLCIDFTRPESAVDNILMVAELKKPIVVGTTGWYDKVEVIRKAIDHHQTAALYGPNFAVGIYIWLQILAKASGLVNIFKGFDTAGIEQHHSQKLDSPSGTALEMAKVAEAHIDHLEHLPITSVRCGSIPGTHTFIIDSPCESISITHTARNREGLAEGAIDAAEWLQGKQGLFTFSDFMQETVKRSLS